MSSTRIISHLRLFIDENTDSELDLNRVIQRQKQIDLGKSTPEYKAYLASVPKYNRIFSRRLTDHPRTPDIYRVVSKRTWAGLVRKWRRQLHTRDDSTVSYSSLRF